MSKHIQSLMLIILLAFVPLSSNAREELSLTYAFFKPFIWTEGGKAVGIYVDIIEEAIVERLGIPVTFTYYPWIRAQSLVHNGKYDGYISLHTPERAGYALTPSDFIISSYLGLYTYAGHKDFEQMKAVKYLSDLKPYELITYPGDGWAKEHEKELNIKFGGPHLNTSFEMLAKKRSDISVYTNEVASYSIRELGLESEVVKVPGVKLKTVEFRLLLSNESPYVGIIPAFNKTILEMKQDGTMKQILKHYR